MAILLEGQGQVKEFGYGVICSQLMVTMQELEVVVFLILFLKFGLFLLLVYRITKVSVMVQMAVLQCRYLPVVHL